MVVLPLDNGCISYYYHQRVLTLCERSGDYERGSQGRTRTRETQQHIYIFDSTLDSRLICTRKEIINRGGTDPSLDQRSRVGLSWIRTTNAPLIGHRIALDLSVGVISGIIPLLPIRQIGLARRVALYDIPLLLR